MATFGDRIVVLVDMDCFFCQVEIKLQPELKGKPLAVVQYNQWQSGGIIAVNYEARDYGVSRHMRGDEAKEKCPNLVLASVPGVRGKPDTSRYRNAGREVIDVLKKHSTIVERASVDEAYLDITEIVDKRMVSFSTSPKQMIDSLGTTFIVGYSDVGKNDEEQRSKGVKKWINTAYGELGDIQSQRLAIAGTIVENMRADVFEKTGFRCSAGISYNKILAKLACGLHKPNRQTILPAAGVPSLFSTLPVKKVRNLGGKLGDVVVESLGCNVMAELLPYSLQDLKARFDDKTGSWLYNIARGIDNELVTSRLVSKSIGCCKNFPGKQAIVSKEVLEHWVHTLATEVTERLEQDVEENERRATLLTVSFHFYLDKKTVSQSRSCPLTSYKVQKIVKQSVDIIMKSTKRPLSFVGLSAGKFVQAKGSENFMNFFKVNNQADADTTQCPDMTVRLERDAAIAVPSTSNGSNSINSKGYCNSSPINVTEGTDSLGNTCATTHESNTDKPTVNNELIRNTSKTDNLEDENTDFPVQIHKSSNKSRNIEENPIFRNQQNSSNGNLKLDYKKGNPLLSEKFSDERGIKIEVTKHCEIESDVVPVSPLTSMNNALHLDKFKKSFFMTAFNKSNATNDKSNWTQRTANISSLRDKLSENEREEDTCQSSFPNSMTKIDKKDMMIAECTTSSEIHREEKEICGELSSENAPTSINIESTNKTVSNESFMRNQNDDLDNDYTNQSLDSTNCSNICTNTNVFSKHDSSDNRDRNIKRIALGSSKSCGTIRGENAHETNTEKCLESDITNETSKSLHLGVMSSSSVVIESNKTVNDQSSLVQLQEIFPDLNDIDQDIVALLPPTLQREANLLLQARKENSTRNTENSIKLQKSKSNKTKSNNSKSVVSRNTNKINSFFKKSNPIIRGDIGPSEKCLQCNKLIPLKNYLEHIDFHVARSLQKEINNSPTDGKVITKLKESVVDSYIKSDKRKRIEKETPATEKKFKSIASFFS